MSPLMSCIFILYYIYLKLRYRRDYGNRSCLPDKALRQRRLYKTCMRALVVDLGNHVLVVHRRGISYNVSFLNVELHLPDFHGGTFRISFPEILELGQVSPQLAAGIGLDF